MTRGTGFAHVGGPHNFGKNGNNSSCIRHVDIGSREFVFLIRD